jgi:pyruvate/2-oxoglutarate dehydrogenase complex dihydrolipoamide dehydrogenase (E3) component
LYHGAAHFISPNEITVNGRHLSAANFLVASGGQWLKPPIIGLDKVDFMTPDQAIDLLSPPKSLLIIGAGAAGVEFAELFSIFGSKVTLAEVKNRILPREDDEISSLISQILQNQRSVNILTGSKVIKVANDGPLKRVTYLSGHSEHSVKVERILIASGRQPNVDLGLANARVKFDETGIDTNEFLQTSARHIYAAGDVVGRYNQTHTAILESRIAAGNILGRKAVPDYRAIPRVTYLTPEIASVGLNETDLARYDIKHKKALIELNQVTRSNISDFHQGFVKIITDKQRVLIGATVAAPSAGQMIHELALAIQYGLTANQVADMTHAFGTWSEAVRLACAKLR